MLSMTGCAHIVRTNKKRKYDVSITTLNSRFLDINVYLPISDAVLEERKLSKKEYDLLLFLYRNAGAMCSRDDIIEAVWPDTLDPSGISDATIDQLVHRLREKVELEPSKPSRIISKKAFGYMLV